MEVDAARDAVTTVSWSFGSELTATLTWVLWTVGCRANVPRRFGPEAEGAMD